MALLRTPLFQWHRDHGGRIVEFGGWEMPVQYTSIVEEHHAVRGAAGLFDISHMGRLAFRGKDASAFLNHLLTCRVDQLIDGQIRYGLVCDAAGGVLDDILVNRIGGQSFGLVVNASNREKIVDWINQHTGDVLSLGAEPPDVVMDDQTMSTAMIAVQGPQALPLINSITKSDLSLMRFYTGQPMKIEGIHGFISRTGYTGEDGFELIVPAASAVGLWETLIAAGAPLGLKPCGLGCRDTLRLEAAMPLYGHELSENVDPLTAGLGFAVKFDKPEFIGREALFVIKEQPNRPVRVGLQLESRRIAREHSEVFAGNERIGEVTSGTFSPTREQSIAMAYVASSCSAPGTEVEIDIRGKREPATVVPLPFYKRAK